MRLITDFPPATFLSGGIDSSINAGLMSRISYSPISKWLKSDIRFLINEYFAKKKVEKQEIFNFKTIEKLISGLLLNLSVASWHLWNLGVFQAWYSRHFIL